MIEKKAAAYTLTRDSATLLFRTATFAPDQGSVLHSGVYNREFSSWLASFTLAGIAYFVLVMAFGKQWLLYLAFMVLFIGTFPLFRRYVFRERFLETVFDRRAGQITISRQGMGRKILESLPLSAASGLRIDTWKSEVVNRDGVEFVQKISAQHNAAIPGFGEETVFYLLKLRQADGTERTLHADRNMQDVMAAYEEIRDFLKI